MSKSSQTNQCPSTVGKKAADARLNMASPVSGARAWRSPEEFASSPEFEEFVAREFPRGASELAKESRRDFMKIMGASMALAGAATIPGCRRPDHKIMPFSKNVPEEVIPGKPTYYATSMPLPGGGAEGLLVETHSGRPTKIEGNPLHPINAGRSSVWAQASVLSLYDPDRLKYPINRDASSTQQFEEWGGWAQQRFSKFDRNQGEGLAFLVEKKSSPTRDAVRDRVLGRFPRATWLTYDAGDFDGEVRGTEAAFGRPMSPQLSLSNADVVLSLDSNFLDEGGRSLVHAREWAAKRRVMTTHDSMSRLYAIESDMSNTGASADHRWAVAPSQIAAVAAAIATRVLEIRGGGAALASAIAASAIPAVTEIDSSVLDAIVDDLAAHAGHSLVVAGSSQPAAVHAMVAAINDALGNVGQTVSYLPVSQDIAQSSLENIRTLASRIRDGQVNTLVTIGVNPVYDAPVDLDFRSLMARVPTTIALSVEATETASSATWSLNMSHYLESWGDVRAADGTISPVQPMIAPLYEPSLSDIEFLALVAGESEPDGFKLVQSVWMEVANQGGAAFEKTWRRALHDGVLGGQAPRAQTPRVDFSRVGSAVRSASWSPKPTSGAMDVVLKPGVLYDGRGANIPWLQELSQPGTRVVWDNPALVSPKTAQALGIAPEWFDEGNSGKMYTKKVPTARMATVTVDGHSMDVAVWILPGMADNTVILHQGGGREVCGRVGDGVGFNTFKIRSSTFGRIGTNATLHRSSGTYPISSTQNHWSMESRTSIVRAVDFAAWQKHGDEVVAHRDTYGNVAELAFGERLGELSHTPKNLNIYDNPSYKSDAPSDKQFPARDLTPQPGSDFASRPQWGMSVDLSTCTGCGACIVACQSENNIPVVGKHEVRKGREMHWMRVDRYFTGDDVNAPEASFFQPVMCVQCENAPCESVCPVNATVHGPEGLNYMVYNRCIGTRYCANNCPYKVRRFNFFDFGEMKVNGDYVGKDMMPGGGPDNVNLIPPKLRERIDQITRMQKNPNVTVRSRGVMEKCTYCIQRINAARVETKLHDLEGPTGFVPEGYFQVACQQACPSEAISFGDLLDEASRVREERHNARSYLLLGYLNTRPRTTYMVRVSNPNPAVLDLTPEGRARIASWEDPFHHSSHGDGHGDDHGGHGDDHGGEHDDHGGDDHGEGDGGHAAGFLDTRKRAVDGGYALSLKVLGAATGVHA